jgi:hypothetical protein
MAERMRPDDVLGAPESEQYHHAQMMVQAQAACEYAYEWFEGVDWFPPGVLAALRTVKETEVLV